MNRLANPTPAETALAEYARLRERAVIDVANRRVRREQAEQVVRHWLAIVLVCGADHPDAAPVLDRYADPAHGFTQAQRRMLAASWISPHGGWKAQPGRAAAKAMAAAEDPACTNPAAAARRARALRDLARALGCEIPLITPAQRKAA